MKSVKTAPILLGLACSLSWLPGKADAQNKPVSPALALARQLNEAFVELAEDVAPSVVVIRVAYKPGQLDLDDKENPLFEYLPPDLRRQFEQQRERERQRREQPNQEPEFTGRGSGVVIREDGFILTNSHVVDKAEKIKVRLKDGREYDATVRGVDTKSDVAVVKIDASGLPVAKLGDSDKTRVGEFAIAIGAPFDLDYSVTFGHISAKGRSNIVPRFMGGSSMDQDFLQTDANINPGNSGGPLININGEVVGINTIIRGINTGIGFAIPINLAKEIASQLVAEGKFVRSWLGIGIEALREMPELNALVKDLQDGVVVTAIVPNGPASKSQLKPSDIITSVDGVEVATVQQLKNQIRSKPVGKDVDLDVVRINPEEGSQRMKLKIQPEAWPEETAVLVSRRTPPANEARQLGLTVKALTRELAAEFNLETTTGIVVTAVEEGSEAERKGIQAGDIVTEVNNKKVTSLREFREAMRGADPKKGVIISLLSEGVSKFQVLKESAE